MANSWQSFPLVKRLIGEEIVFEGFILDNDCLATALEVRGRLKNKTEREKTKKFALLQQKLEKERGK